MNEHLERLYASVKDAVVAHHPHDESLVGAIAELFLKFDKDILILEEKAAKYDRYVKHLASIEEHGVWGAINRLDAKLEAVKDLAVKLLAWSDDGVSWMFSEAPGATKKDRAEYAELTKAFRELLGIKVDCEEGS